MPGSTGERGSFITGRLKTSNTFSVIEQGLGSIARVRILRLLSISEGMTRYKISTASGLGYREIDRALRTLIKIGWVEELPVNPKRYRLNTDNEIIKRLAGLFSITSV